MFIVEWCFGVGSPLRSKRAETEGEAKLWSSIALANGASLVVVSPEQGYDTQLADLFVDEY